MRGRTLMGAMLGFAALFGGALWYAQNYAYYAVTTPQDYPMDLTAINGPPQPIKARNFTILDANSSPLKFRACFTVDETLPALKKDYRIYPKATPLVPPSWFSCFNVAKITEDLKSGKAVAFLGQKNIADGVDQVVAIYGDGQAYAWHQLNDKFADK